MQKNIIIFSISVLLLLLFMKFFRLRSFAFQINLCLLNRFLSFDDICIWRGWQFLWIYWFCLNESVLRSACHVDTACDQQKIENNKKKIRSYGNIDEQCVCVYICKMYVNGRQMKEKKAIKLSTTPTPGCDTTPSKHCVVHFLLNNCVLWIEIRNKTTCISLCTLYKNHNLLEL